MQTHVQKGGKSLGMRIPVDITVEGGVFIVYPKEHKLESMLALVNPKNLHHVVFEDGPKGEELL